jgi:hypothetical protein
MRKGSVLTFIITTTIPAPGEAPTRSPVEEMSMIIMEMTISTEFTPAIMTIIVRLMMIKHTLWLFLCVFGFTLQRRLYSRPCYQ